MAWQTASVERGLAGVTEVERSVYGQLGTTRRSSRDTTSRSTHQPRQSASQAIRSPTNHRNFSRAHTCTHTGR
jgi:hypothetical protein